MDKEKGFIKYIVIIIVILVIVFLSQLSYFKESGGNFFYRTGNGYDDTSDSFWAKGSNWVQDNIFSKIGGEVQKRGDMAKEELNAQKEKVSESIGEKIKNYFSGIVDSVFSPGKNKTETETQTQNCPACTTPYQPNLDCY